MTPAVLRSSAGPTGNNQAIGDVVVIGNISVRGAQNGNIVLIVDNGMAGMPDGAPDLVIRFAPKKKRAVHQNLSLDLQDSRLFFSDRRVVVIGSDGHVWVSLALETVGSDDPSFALYGARSTDLPQTVRISKGYALQRQSVLAPGDGSIPGINLELPIFFERSASDKVNVLDDPPPDEEDGEGQLPCSGSGRGATQCSYSCGGETCSVTCGSGWYACCGCRNSLPYCNCRPN